MIFKCIYFLHSILLTKPQWKVSLNWCAINYKAVLVPEIAIISVPTKTLAYTIVGFPGSLAGEESKCNAGDCLSNEETWVWSLGQGDPLEKKMATHSRILALELPRTQEPGGLHSMWSQDLDMTMSPNYHHTTISLLLKFLVPLIFSTIKCDSHHCEYPEDNRYSVNGC